MLREGNEAKARELFNQAVDITPKMAHQLIKRLQAANIEYVVAPYEADAQMAFLSIIGDVDCIITEDSDLLAFGSQKVCQFLRS